jgi:acyl-coenzyme A synthetase/AMP-(fatty) acid ligase
MAPPNESARSRILATLTTDLGRPLARTQHRTWTAAQVIGAASVLRPMFMATGGETVGVAFTQPGFVLAALLAAWAAGRRPLLFDPGLRREAEVLRRIHPGVCIYSDTGGSSDDRIEVGETLAAALPATCPPAWLTVPADDHPFASLFTSASTGDNKVVAKLGFQFYRQAEALVGVLGLPVRGRVLSFVPPYHLLGLFYGLVLPLVLDSETVVATELTGAAMVELLAKYRPTLAIGTATHYRFLARAKASADVVQSGTVYLSSGAPLDPTVAEAFASRYGTSVRDFYGSTELGGVAFRAWPDPYHAMPGVRWRIDPDTAGLEVNSPWAGGAEGDWLATGDAAEPAAPPSDQVGFRLLGRMDHMVKVGGKRFSSLEVEQALRTMPGIAEAAVLPYLRFGEPAIAAVIAPEAAHAPTEPAVRAFLAERLATYKLPRTVLMLAQLPRGSHDKVDYRALRALLTP